MDTKERLQDCFRRIGVPITDTENDIDLKEYITDLMQLVMAIIEIESRFNIEFPDELFVFSTFDSFDRLVNIINSMLKDGDEDE